MKAKLFIAVAFVDLVFLGLTAPPPIVGGDEIAQATKQARGENRADVPVPVPRPSWIKRNEKINERAKQGDVDMVFIGDSIMEGWIVPANSSWPEGGGGEEVWKKYYGHRKAMNAGISGDW